MQILIEISEKEYEHIKKDIKLMESKFIAVPSLYNIIANGTPLPEHHGNLKDANSVPKEDRDIIVKSLLRPGTIAFVGAITLEEYVDNLPTIIPSTKEGAE